MANYGAIITDDGNGNFYISALNRGTTTTSFSGGTDLLTNTVTVTAGTGLLATASGFLDTTNLASTGDQTLGRKLRGVVEAFFKAGEIAQNDRAFNG